MKPRLIAILVLIVFLPLALVAGLGWRMARSEREMLRLRVQEILVGRLRDVDADIQGVLSRQGRALLRLQGLSGRSPEELRALTAEQPAVTQFFALDPSGALIYPAPQGSLTDDERAFLNRSREIWLDREIPPRNAEQPPVLALAPQRALPPKGQSFPSKGGKGITFEKGGTAPQQALVSKEAPVSEQYGWYSWFWGNGLRLIYWWREGNGRVAGAELNPSRLLSEILNNLPDTDPRNPVLPDGRIVLRDAQGEPIYQWGLYEPRLDRPEESPRASLSLSPPLSAWRLDYYGPSDTLLPEVGNSLLFNVFSAVVVIALAVLGLAYYFYRENAREMREAAQRISFVNQVSHELKTPLTNIRMYAEMLEEDFDPEDERGRRRLAVITSESQRLSRLIANVLSFSRKQRSALRLRPSVGVVDEVLHGVVDHFSALLAAKGMALELQGNAPHAAEFDADVVEQVVGNLLSNVEKYASGGKRVLVASAQAGDTTVVSVADDGPGIPSRERRRIFDPFYRVSNRLTDGVAGTGIGLTIARDLARLHGGDVVLEDTRTGACFSFTFRAPRREAS